MSPAHEYLARTRRDFLTTSACGLGGVARLVGDVLGEVASGVLELVEIHGLWGR